jgi:hypothetical protein
MNFDNHGIYNGFHISLAGNEIPFGLSPSATLRTGYAERSRRLLHKPCFDFAAEAATLSTNGGRRLHANENRSNQAEKVPNVQLLSR